MKSKLFTQFIMAGLVLIGSAFPTAHAASYVIGLSPNYETADRVKVLQQTLLFMLQGAATGDDITVCDAWNLHVVTRVKIAKGGILQDNAQARARHLGGSIAAVKDFVLAEHAYSPEVANAIRLPEFIDLAGAQLRLPGQTLRIILIGSPLYVSDDHAFDEHDAYPSDAALSMDVRSSPFSTLSRKNTLTGVSVHFAYLHDCFINDFHRERITRFLTLFLKEQSGCLVTFALDPSLAFQRAIDNIQQAVVQVEIDPNDTKLEMRRVRARSVPLWFAPVSQAQPPIVTNLAPQSAPTEPIHPTVSSNSPPSITNQAPNALQAVFPITVTNNIIGIGLMWKAPVDLDLYVLPKNSARELYYGRTQTPEGKYFHDYRTANAGLDYEYVELKTPVDIRNVKAWVNYYWGNAGPIQGKAIVYYDGKTYAGEFSLAARSGNRGDESRSRGTSAYWSEIDLLKIVGLK